MFYLAPLHNPAAVVGIKASLEVVPNAIQTAVFDTSFHQNNGKKKHFFMQCHMNGIQIIKLEDMVHMVHHIKYGCF